LNEVSTVTFGFFEAAARRGVIRLEDLLQGIPIPLERLRDPEARLDWDTFAVLCERFETLAGGPSISPELGTCIIESTATSGVRKLAGLFTSSEAIYAAVVRWYAPSQVRNLRFSHREHGKRRLEVMVEVPSEYRDCPAYFRLLSGAFRALPRMLGQPDAIVESHIEPRRVV